MSQCALDLRRWALAFVAFAFHLDIIADVIRANVDFPTFKIVSAFFAFTNGIPVLETLIGAHLRESQR